LRGRATSLICFFGPSPKFKAQIRTNLNLRAGSSYCFMVPELSAPRLEGIGDDGHDMDKPDFRIELVDLDWLCANCR